MAYYGYYNKRSEENVLIQGERRDLTVGDVQIILNNCSKSYASNILRSLWFQGFMKRKRIRQRGGIKYRYILTRKGEERIRCIREKKE